MVRKRPVSHILRCGGLVIAIVLCGLLAFGISGADESALRGFDEAAGRSQSNPEFRAVAMEYCTRGSRVLRTRPFLTRAGALMLAMRSVPMLPDRLSIQPTSRAHYEQFGKGSLSAYLFLCGEQPLTEFVGIVESAGRLAEPSAADLQRVLDAFRTHFPVCKDAGAIESVASLLHDVAPDRPFAVRQNIAPLLLPHIRDIAGELQVPADPAAMTAQEQSAVLDRLDGQVRRSDPELWRTKQVSDFCGGVWAQAYSPPYRRVIGVVLVFHQLAVPVLLALSLWPMVRRTHRLWRRFRVHPHVRTDSGTPLPGVPGGEATHTGGAHLRSVPSP